MKRIIPVFLALALLTGCGGAMDPVRETEPAAQAPLIAPEAVSEGYTSRFDRETAITLSDDGITVNGGGETSGVFTSRDIVYYEDRLTYDSGHPYGEGKQSDMHTAQEARSHLVVNITEPGAYRVSGQLDAGQIRMNLGKKADSDPDAVVELILDGADIIILHQYFLFLSSFFVQHTFARDVDAIVGTCHLAQAASNTLVIAVFVGRHSQASTETWRYFQSVTIFRILFGHFLRKEFTTSDFHTCQ